MTGTTVFESWFSLLSTGQPVVGRKMVCDVLYVCCRYAERERELLLIEKRLQGAEAQVNDLQARLNDAVIQRKQWETQCNVRILAPSVGLCVM